MLPYGRNLNVSGLASRALNDFHSIVGNLLSHIDSKGNTNQIGVLELHTRTFIAIIEQYVDASVFKSASDVLGGSADLLVAGVGGDYHHFKRCDRSWQPEPVFVIRLLDRRRQNALDANPVTPHDWDDFLPIAVEHARAHRLGILVAEFEDVSDFDRRVDAQSTTA